MGQFFKGIAPKEAGSPILSAFFIFMPDKPSKSFPSPNALLLIKGNVGLTSEEILIVNQLDPIFKIFEWANKNNIGFPLEIHDTKVTQVDQ
jgi:hypothetical protein